MKALEFVSLSDAEAIAFISPIIIENHNETGILSSVLLAQFIYESDYGKSELAQKSNNVFGMKAMISGNTWENTMWDGTSICRTVTSEMNAAGETYRLPQDFRAYASIEESVRDHGMYLLHARNGNNLRYEGINTTTDPEQAANILFKGGYSSSALYPRKLMKIIRVWNLRRFD